MSRGKKSGDCNFTHLVDKFLLGYSLVVQCFKTCMLCKINTTLTFSYKVPNHHTLPSTLLSPFCHLAETQLKWRTTPTWLVCTGQQPQWSAAERYLRLTPHTVVLVWYISPLKPQLSDTDLLIVSHLQLARGEFKAHPSWPRNSYKGDARQC